MRRLLVHQLAGHGAHICLAAAVKGFLVELAGKRLPRLQHTARGLVYHLRIAQWDILEYARGVEHDPLPYPSGYRPRTAGPREANEWQRTLRSFSRDLKAMQGMLLGVPVRDW